jgi:hypothetical protein
MCVEFYLILKIAGAKQSLLWKMIIYSLIMLVTGYFGSCFSLRAPLFWGAVSGLAYFAIVYENMVRGSPNRKAAGECTLRTKYYVGLCRLVNLPIRVYETTGWYNGIIPAGNIDVVYNIADAINKIGFGLVIYTLAVKSQTN